MSDAPRKMVPIRDIARQLSCSTDTVRRLIKAGKAPAVKLGNEWRADPQAFVAALTYRRPD